MYGFPLDHLQRLVIILYYDMSARYVCVKLFKTKKDRKAFSLYIGISDFNISKHFTANGYGLIVLEELAPRPYSLALVCSTRGCVLS